MNPAGKFYYLSDMRFAQLEAIVCSIFMHLVNVVRVSAAVIISVAANIAF